MLVIRCAQHAQQQATSEMSISKKKAGLACRECVVSQQAGASPQHSLSLQEVTLELMLLGSCADPKPKEQAMVGGRASGKGPAAAALDCELLCHVAMANQLPPVDRYVVTLGPLLAILRSGKQDEACASQARFDECVRTVVKHCSAVIGGAM